MTEEERAAEAYRQMAKDIEEEQGTPEQRRQARNERYARHQKKSETVEPSAPVENTEIKRGYGDLNGIMLPDRVRISTRRTPGLEVGEKIVLEDTSDDQEYDAIVLSVHERSAIVRFDLSTGRDVRS